MPGFAKESFELCQNKGTTQRDGVEHPDQWRAVHISNAQEYDDISEASNEEVTENTDSMWIYKFDNPTDPPEYIPGFNIKLPLKYTFEFVFPAIFRRIYLPPPCIPQVFLFWTSRNPNVLRHFVRKIACTSLGMVVESLEKKWSIRTLFWKAGLAAMFGSHDASFLLKFAAYKLVLEDWKSAFYLYTAAMLRIARKLETSKTKMKSKDKDCGKVNPRSIVLHKHSRLKRSIFKLKRKPICSILKTKRLVKISFYVKEDCIRDMLRNLAKDLSENKKEKSLICKVLTWVDHEEEIRAKDIAEDLANELAYGDCGELSTDQDFEYKSLLRESDDEYIKKGIKNILKYECSCVPDLAVKPVPHLKGDILKCTDRCDKIISFNFPDNSLCKQTKHSETCIESIDPDICYLVSKIANHVLKSTNAVLKNLKNYDIPVSCMEMDTTKHIVQTLLNESVNSWFRGTPKAHPIFELPLKYLSVDLNAFIAFKTKEGM